MTSVTKEYAQVTDHGKLTKVLDDVYVVQGSFHLGIGILIARTMTIIKSGDNLTIVNSIRVDDEVLSEIRKLGTVKHLVRMSSSHGCDDSYYLDAFKPTYWSPEGIEPFPETRAHDKASTEEGEAPIPGMKTVILKKAKESVFWIPCNGGTVISCDLIQNAITSPHANWAGVQMSKLMGFQGECKCVPMWRMANGMDHWEDIERAFAWDFENLISAHGEAKIGGAKTVTERNLKAVWKK